MRFCLFSLYLLCHVGLRKVVEDKRNLLLDILWRLYDPFCLVSGHQQGVNVGCVYGGLQVGTRTFTFETGASLYTGHSFCMQKNINQLKALTSHILGHIDINIKAKLTGTSFLKLLGVGLVMVGVLATVVVVVAVVTRVLG